jgi:hypothetical protein
MGRKPIADELKKKQKTFTITMSPLDFDRFEEFKLSRFPKKSRSFVVRKILFGYLNRVKE